MKNLKGLLGIALLGIVLINGCGNSKINRLPHNAVSIEKSIFVNKNDFSDEYASVIYNGREYVFYGVQSKSMKENVIRECFGYDAKDKNVRYYSLIDTEDYIADYCVNGEMMQFGFYRAVDTIGKTIYTPAYISGLEYEIWK
ncbi:hypothetical protein [Cellulosilyticum ruminicola]|uniref:hypothetical protein n=1 Tax=Cellulosilyticum ruminicola TaxID=425254 RepID=UPI0006D06853|nr:hypothetical protein [Cellulosilyticum ruminicola]